MNIAIASFWMMLGGTLGLCAAVACLGVIVALFGVVGGLIRRRGKPTPEQIDGVAKGIVNRAARRDRIRREREEQAARED